MKHFIGGYSVGFIIMFVWLMERGTCGKEKFNGGNGIIVASIFAVPFGLAAWGLLP